MDDIRLGAIESRFAGLIWDREPMTTRELVALCQKELNWKRTTTYTVLKKLCEKGLFQLEEGVVRALISRQEFEAMQSEKFVEDTFQRSLPAFLAAFQTRKKLSDAEIDELQKVIDRMRG